MLRNVMLYLFLETILKNLPGEFDALEYSSTRDRGKRKIKFYDEVHVNHMKNMPKEIFEFRTLPK